MQYNYGGINVWHAPKKDLIAYCRGLKSSHKENFNIIKSLEKEVSSLKAEIAELNKVADRSKLLLSRAKIVEAVKSQPTRTLPGNKDLIVEYLMRYYSRGGVKITLDGITGVSKKAEFVYVRKMICYILDIYYRDIMSSYEIAIVINREGSTARSHIIEMRDIVDSGINKTISADVLEHITYINGL